MPLMLLSFLRTALPGLLLILALAGLYVWGYTSGKASNEAEWQAKLQAQENEALKQQQKMQEKVNEVTATLQADKRSINAKYVAVLDELRNRPADRLPDTSRAACNGATGAELSRPDAVFLVGEAARADKLAADLRACQAYIRTVTGKK